MNNITDKTFNPLKLLSLLLLIPLGIILFSYALVPVLDNLEMSTQDVDLFDHAEEVGNRNYERLEEDKRLDKAVAFTSRMVGTRIFIVTVLPAIVGILIGAQGWALRGVNRLLLAVVAVCFTPVTMAILWRCLFSRYWDTDPVTENPLDIPESLFLGSPEGAQNNVILLDSLLTMGASIALISLFYIAAVRGKQLGGRPLLAGLAIWLISILVTLMSFSQLFVLPKIITDGRPLDATMTLSLYAQEISFKQFRLGFGAASSTIFTVATLILAFLVWLLLTGFNLRLRYTAPGKAFSKGSWASLASILLILATGLPIVLLALWGISYVQRNGGFDPVLDLFDQRHIANNTVNTPWQTIWFVQIPFAYLAALALGFWRPLGRIGSSILFLPLLALSFLPTEILAPAWFMKAREADLLNSTGMV
jgi:ABC-type sugar transport system permease subunit